MPIRYIYMCQTGFCFSLSSFVLDLRCHMDCGLRENLDVKGEYWLVLRAPGILNSELDIL